MTTPPNDTPTPRTDAVCQRHYGTVDGQFYQVDEVPADFARTLERELAEAKAQRDELNKRWDFARAAVGAKSDTTTKEVMDRLATLKEDSEANATELCRVEDALGYRDRWVGDKGKSVHESALDKIRDLIAKLGELGDERDAAIKELELHKQAALNGAKGLAAERDAFIRDRDAASAEAEKWEEVAGQQSRSSDHYQQQAAKWRDGLSEALYAIECALPFVDAHVGARICSSSGGPRALREILAKYPARKPGQMPLCQSPTPSSPSSEPLPCCGRCGKPLPDHSIPIGGTYYCSIGCAETDPMSYGPPSPPTATVAYAPAEATASRLQALESAQALQQRKMTWLLERCSVLSAALCRVESRFSPLPTAWPADLALTESTFTSPATQKPESSGDGDSE